MTFPFSRRRRERRATRNWRPPETGETITEILGRVRPARYHGTAIRAAAPAWDGTAWGGASDAGLPAGAVFGPPPAAPEDDCTPGHRGEICDTCWLCPWCCPGLENCAIAIDEDDAEMTA